MVVRELDPAVDRYLVVLRVYLSERRASEAGSGGDQGTPQRLGDVSGVDVAADDPRHHRPEGEEVILGDDEDADVLALLYALADLLRGREAAEATAYDEDLVLELLVAGLLPGSIAGLRVERPPECSQRDDDPTKSESPLQKSVHDDLPALALFRHDPQNTQLRILPKGTR